MSRLYNSINKQRRLIKNNREEIDLNNKKFINILLLIELIKSVFTLVLASIVKGAETFKVETLIPIILVILVTLIVLNKRKSVKPSKLLYWMYFFSFIQCIYTSIVISSPFISVGMLVLLFIIPIATLDKSYKINLITIFYATIYCIFIKPGKEIEVVLAEVAGIILFSASAIIIGSFLRNSRLENYDLRRKGIIRETTDILTGLKNRRRLFEILESKESSNITSIIMLDIDNFKEFNDTYGHQSGDQCLRRVGRCFYNFSKKYPIKFFRYGGEEFIGVVSGKVNLDYLNMCRELNNDVYNLRIENRRAKNKFITVSIGLRVVERNEDYTKCNEWIREADIALYAAKRSGKNQTRKYSETPLVNTI